MEPAKTEKIVLCDVTECTGCFACETICPKKAISQCVSEEGFNYPVIDGEICISCHACEKICPVLNRIEKNAQGDIYASWIRDVSIRKQSSSGGIFSALAISIIGDGGVVVGAKLCDDNYVRHVIVSDINGLGKIRGSKYVQSLIGRELIRNIKEHLDRGVKVLFCGTPCQVAGVRSALKNSPLLYTIDLVCHGVPSPVLFSRLLSDIRKKIPNVVSYNFRDTEKWLVCSNVNVNVNGHIVNRRLYGIFTFYQDAFLKGYLHRSCCYHCHYCSPQRIGDITLGDFWGVGKKIPFSGDVSSGCSLVSVNSPKGRILFDAIKAQIEYEHRELIESIEGGNRQLVEPSAYPKERHSFYKDAYALPYKKLIRKYRLEVIKRPSIIVSCISKIHNCLMSHRR